jgi:glycosyltransferase involved in cell wall biosynthesis
MEHFEVSLVIPVYNEEDSIKELVESIQKQSFQPSEIIIVDGGSTDNTVNLVKELSENVTKLKLIETKKALPGEGRNIGTRNACNEWIAYTDAGITLTVDWLEKLVETASKNQEIDIVYGNYAPITNNFFEMIAAIAYVPAQNSYGIRGKSIASYLMKKKVWTSVGGFPNYRAAEDLMFMDAAEKQGFKFTFAPEAMIYWRLRPDLFSTFHKFVLYSKHNVWAGRQWDWHYGIAKQYLILIPFLFLAFFHGWWWLIFVLLWLFARTVKRILPHRFEFATGTALNPIIFFGVAILILTIDLATFIGWGQAVLQKKK